MKESGKENEKRPVDSVEGRCERNNQKDNAERMHKKHFSEAFT